MTPDQARKDKDQNYANGCYANHEATTVVAGDQCVAGDPDGIPVVLYGDSHAEQWFQPLSEIAKAKGWRLLALTKMACPPGGEVVHNATAGGAYIQCQKWREQALHRIDEEAPKLVIVATRAGYYQVSKDGQQLSVAQSAPLLGAALARDLSHFKDDLGAQVILMADTPAPGFNVPDCLTEKNAAQCGYDFADSLPDTSHQLAAAQAAGATVIDLNHEICATEPSCTVVQDGLVVFRDDDHLAATFAATLAEELAAQLPSPTT